MPLITKKIHTNQETDNMAIIYSDLKSNVAIKALLETEFLNKCGYGMLILELVNFTRNPLVNNRDRPNGRFRFGAELELRGMTYEEGEIITDCKIVNIVESSTLGTVQYFGKSEHAMILLKYQPEIQHYAKGDIVPVVVKDTQFDLHKPMIAIGATPLTYSSLLDIDAEEEESDRVYHFSDFAEWEDIQKIEELYIQKKKDLDELGDQAKLVKFADIINPYKKTSITRLEKKGFAGFKQISLTDLRESSKSGLTGEIIHPYFSHPTNPMVYYKEGNSKSGSHNPIAAIQGIWNQKIRGLNLLIDLMKNHDPTDKEFLSGWSVFEKSKK
jgi:hypothetical protein